MSVRWRSAARPVLAMPFIVVVSCALGAGQAAADGLRADLRLHCLGASLTGPAEILFWRVELTELHADEVGGFWRTGEAYDRWIPAAHYLCSPATPTVSIRFDLGKLPAGTYSMAITGLGRGDRPAARAHAPVTTRGVNFCKAEVNPADTTCLLDHTEVAPLAVIRVAPPP